MSERNASIIPAMRYRNAAKAIEWLCGAFGFEKHMVVPGENGTIAHAQLIFGNGMIMLGSMHDNDFGKVVQPPKSPEFINTQSAYVVVKEIDQHYKKAVAAGADIIIDIEDADYGGRGYTCRDPEGVVWSFGSYDPWN